MVTLKSHDIISIVELCVYTPTALLTYFVCARHSFRRAAGWICVLMLCLIRVAGAICQLLTHNDPTNIGLLKAVGILEAVGVSPLLLATSGLLTRL
jgi:hypothetical protein